MPCSRTQHINNVPRLRGEKHDISLKILHQAGFETARQAATSAERHALTIAPCPFVVTSLKCFGWNNVGPASQTVAQHYFTIGPMYCVIREVVFRGIRVLPVWQTEQTRDNHPILFQCWASVEYDCQALNHQWAATVAQHRTGIGWIGLH